MSGLVEGIRLYAECLATTTVHRRIRFSRRALQKIGRTAVLAIFGHSTKMSGPSGCLSYVMKCTVFGLTEAVLPAGEQWLFALVRKWMKDEFSDLGMPGCVEVDDVLPRSKLYSGLRNYAFNPRVGKNPT